MRTVAVEFTDRVHQLQVFSLIDLVVNADTLFLQIFVTGRIAARMGLGYLLVTVPLTIAIGFVGLASVPYLPSPPRS